ncbi:YggS family pyridoxal phosphate-dependent enzyme [Trueperella sp. LYQ143]|uniref:YggS family pyridoxal phosphate-dependent enzyme n=1 Tax=unclassified Trueperella TaxID=2630174 RepID=UPI0039835629
MYAQPTFIVFMEESTSMLSAQDITERLSHVHAQIRQAQREAGRTGEQVDLMLAVKYQPLAAILAAASTGEQLFGHNIVQQLCTVAPALKEANAPAKHCVIGPVQSNKLRAAMDNAHRIDTVDSLQQAERIARRQEARIKEGLADGPFPILLQINSANAVGQSGCAPDEAYDIARRISHIDLVRIDGVMTIGAHSTERAVIRASFDLTRQLSAEIRSLPGLSHADVISMGMTQDLDVAIAAGSTLVRVGTAIFGARPTPA